MENVVILGTGSAGLTAAIYTARANLNPLVVAGNLDGGQLTLTTEVENFPGFQDGIDGTMLMTNMRKQAERFVTKFKQGLCNNIEKIDGGFKLTIGTESIESKTIIIATGATARWLNIPSEKQFQGKGVHTCATCDGFFYKGKEIMVIGGGDSMAEEATFLTKFASKVTVVHRRDEFRASKIMADRVFKNENIDIIWDSTIDTYNPDESGEKLGSVTLKNLKTNETTQHKIDGVFLAIGHVPNTTFCKDIIDLDEHGFIKTNRRMQTSVPGIFAAGDVQDVIYKQAITAAGSGCQAGMEVEKYLE